MIGCIWCGRPAAPGDRWCRAAGHCIRARREAMRHDAAVDWFRARLVQTLIRDSWTCDEMTLRSTDIPDRDGLRRLEGWAVPVVAEVECMTQSEPLTSE